MRRLPRRWLKKTSAFVLGVDTNVLVRFFTRDDEVQAEQARRIITSAQNQPIRISVIALVELVWVLTKVKRWPQSEVFAACGGLLQSDDFIVEEAALIEQSLIEAQRAACDLADAVIAAMNARAGCRTTVTFDLDAQALAGMTPAETFS